MNTPLEQYKAALLSNREYDCYNNKIKFFERDSFAPGLTDMHILWEDCIIPLYLEGDLELPMRIDHYIVELLNSNDVICIFNALECMRNGIILSGFHRLPFNMDFLKHIDLARQAVLTNADKFKNYQGKEFSSFLESPYDIVAEMVGLKEK